MESLSDHEVIFVMTSVMIHYLIQKGTIYLWSRANFQHIREQVSSLCENFINAYSVSTDLNSDQIFENM